MHQRSRPLRFRGGFDGGNLLGLHWTASEMLTLMAAVLLVAALGAALLTPLMRHAALAPATDDTSQREQTTLAAQTRCADQR